jgi:hypothetical protein
MKVSGYGAPMDELIDKVLPHFLPGKREHPAKKTQPDPPQPSK